MDNKEYGVKLNLDISKYLQGFNKAKEVAEKSKKEIETSVRKVKISRDGKEEELKIKSNVKEITKDFEKLESVKKRIEKGEIKIFRNDIPEISEHKPGADVFGNTKGYPINPKSMGYDPNFMDLSGYKEDIKEVDEDINKSKEDMNNLGDETEKTKGKGQGISIIFSRFGDDISKSINKGISSIKRFGLSLLGIRGAYTALIRAVNSYMAQDKDMHTRLQANWIALGAMLAPVIEYLIRLFQKLVAYINIFVKAFSKNKVDLLSKAMKMVEKNTKGTTKAVKSLNKELGTLDEIENLNFDQGGGDIDTGGGFEIGDALKEIQNMKLNKNLVNFFEELGKKLRALSDKVLPFLKDHFVELITVLGILWGTIKIIQLVKFINDLKNLTGVVGTGGSGLVGAIGLLIGSIVLLTSRIVGNHQKQRQLVKDIEDEIKQRKELKKIIEEKNDAYNDYLDAIDGETEAQKHLNEIQQETGMSGEELYKQVKDGAIDYKDLTEQQREVYRAYKDLKDRQDEVASSKKEYVKWQKEEKAKNIDIKIANDDTGKSYQDLKQEIINAWENGEITTEQAQERMARLTKNMTKEEGEAFAKDIPEGIKKGLNTGQYRDDLSKLGEVFYYKMREIADGSGNIFAKTLVWAMNKQLEKANFTVKNLGSSLKATANSFSVPLGLEVSGFAKGNVAYQPTMAEFGEYAGARSNPEITAPQNMMRETLFEALSDALPLVNSNSGDTILYVNGRELARATYNDFKAEGNRLGGSSIAVRRSS